jgi:hypothetical protein
MVRPRRRNKISTRSTGTDSANEKEGVLPGRAQQSTAPNNDVARRLECVFEDWLRAAITLLTSLTIVESIRQLFFVLLLTP